MVVTRFFYDPADRAIGESRVVTRSSCMTSAMVGGEEEEEQGPAELYYYRDGSN